MARSDITGAAIEIQKVIHLKKYKTYFEETNAIISCLKDHEQDKKCLEKIAPFLERLIKPRLDKYETNDYINDSTDCENALKAYQEGISMVPTSRPMGKSIVLMERKAMINVEDYIKEQLEEIDIQELVRDEIKSCVASDIRKNITVIVKEEISGIIKAEIDICMSSRIKTDDGWGDKNEYDSFMDLFKELFKKKLNDSWDIKKLIEKTIKEAVDSLFRRETEKIKSKVVEEVRKLYTSEA